MEPYFANCKVTLTPNRTSPQLVDCIYIFVFNYHQVEFSETFSVRIIESMKLRKQAHKILARYLHWMIISVHLLYKPINENDACGSFKKCPTKRKYIKH